MIAGASIEVLLENLKLPEMNARKRSQRELRGRDRAAVVAAAEAFADVNRADERLQLESLWATWGQQAPSLRLLDRCLTAKDHRVRAAAVRVVRHCLHLLDEPERLLLSAAGDDHPRVRLEAPTEPITINLNIKIEQEVRIKVERDLEQLFKSDSKIF